MEDFLDFLIRPLLGVPDALVIKTEGNSTIIKVADSDTGRLIGKHGSTIHSIRTLVKTFCALHSLPSTSIVLDVPLK